MLDKQVRGGMLWRKYQHDELTDASNRPVGDSLQQEGDNAVTGAGEGVSVTHERRKAGQARINSGDRNKDRIGYVQLSCGATSACQSNRSPNPLFSAIQSQARSCSRGSPVAPTAKSGSWTHFQMTIRNKVLKPRSAADTADIGAKSAPAGASRWSRASTRADRRGEVGRVETATQTFRSSLAGWRRRRFC
jgi:hypothetical protein